VRANPDVDGIYACLHGSMVAVDEEDPEGYLLEETRRIVGEDVPIVVSLDLYGVLTRRMPLGLAADLQLASAIPGTAFVEYLTGSPYIDSIVTDPWRLDGDGMLAVPSTPGLGITLDFDRVAHHARGERLPVAR
jgi:L-alanine-DL-glutamate epimerase-like enolase superfamily enzyme